jgi:hypothetical protein
VKSGALLLVLHFFHFKEGGKIMLYKMIVIAGVMFALFVAAVSGVGGGEEVSETEGKDVRDSRFGVWLTTDWAVYTPEQPVNIEFCVFNRTGEEITLYFRNAQRYDFTIEDEEGKEVWRWSEGRMFAQMLGEEILGPSNPEVIYTAEYRNKLSPSYYKITGIFVARDRPMSGSIVVEGG